MPVSTERVFGVGAGIMIAGIILQVIILRATENEASYDPFLLAGMTSMIIFAIGGFLIAVREKGLDLKQPLRYPTEGFWAVVEGFSTIIFSTAVFLGMLYALIE